MKIYKFNLKTGIRRSPKFAEKKLADFAVNIGTKCGHGCTYCSTGTMLRMHPSFKAVNESPFESGYAIIDPDMPAKVAADAKRIKKRGMIQLCTTVDAWAPEAKAYDLGRRCLEAILAEPGWTVRILTKNAAVVEDFDLIAKHRDRVLVGLSLTGTPPYENIITAIEPNASPIMDRYSALWAAKLRGLRTYAMLCPMLPGIASDFVEIQTMVDFAHWFEVEEIFAEPINSRGPGLRLTQAALEAKGACEEAEAIAHVRKRENWSQYVVDLLRNTQTLMREKEMINKLRFLLYPSRLLPEHVEEIRKDDEGVIWL